MSTAPTQQRNWRDILGKKKPEGLAVEEGEKGSDPLQPIHDLADGYVMRKASLEMALGAPGPFNLDDLYSPPPETSMTHLAEWMAALDELLYYRPRPMDYCAGLVMQDAELRIEHLLMDLRVHQELHLAATKAGYRQIEI